MVNLTVKPSSPVTVQGFPPVTCAGQPLNLTAIGAVTYAWSNSATGAQITVNPTGNTSYSVTGTNVFNCNSTGVYLATVKPNPTVTANASSQNICAGGETATLTAGGASTYHWASTTMNLNANPIVVSGNTTGQVSYSVTGTDASGCTSTTVYQLSVDACTGLSKSTIAQGVRVYPNPASSDLMVEANGITAVQLIDLTGRTIMTEKASEGKASLNLVNLANGVYYVKVSSANGLDVIKVVKN